MVKDQNADVFTRFHYHQHWRATVKEKHVCEECGELAVYAVWEEVEKIVTKVDWYCKIHCSVA